MLREDLVGFYGLAEVLIDGKKPKGLQNLNDGSLYISSTPKIGECKICSHAVYGLDNYHGGEYIGYCPECKVNKTESDICKR